MKGSSVNFRFNPNGDCFATVQLTYDPFDGHDIKAVNAFQRALKMPITLEGAKALAEAIENRPELRCLAGALATLVREGEGAECFAPTGPGLEMGDRPGHILFQIRLGQTRDLAVA